MALQYHLQLGPGAGGPGLYNIMYNNEQSLDTCGLWKEV